MTKALEQERIQTPPLGLPVLDEESKAPWTAIALITASTVFTAFVVYRGVASVASTKTGPWILGRASGVTTYLLLVALVSFGLLLSHPWRARWRRPSPVVRIRIHVALATFTLAFLVLHIVVLATDPWAQVGWLGALVPFASTYRPVPVTLGVISTYAGLITGLTAMAASRWARRIWFPIHRVAALSLLAAWLHGVTAGADSAALWWMYAVTGVLIAVLAASRYMARTPADEVAALGAR